jgi:Na+-transporting NADH:ubiquinone oxidoreductase subunit NqrC
VDQSRVISVVMVVCFLSGVLVGASYMGVQFNQVKELLSVTENQVELLRSQVEVLKATVKTLQELVKFYEDLLGITRVPRGLPQL